MVPLRLAAHLAHPLVFTRTRGSRPLRALGDAASCHHGPMLRACGDASSCERGPRPRSHRFKTRTYAVRNLKTLLTQSLISAALAGFSPSEGFGGSGVRSCFRGRGRCLTGRPSVCKTKPPIRACANRGLGESPKTRRFGAGRWRTTRGRPRKHESVPDPR